MPSGYGAYARKRGIEVETVSLVDSVEEALEQRWAARERRVIKFLEWCRRIPEPKSGTLDFDRFPYQPEMYEEFGGGSRNVVAMKSVQVGASALTARVAIYDADTQGLRSLYIFPTKSDAYDFVDTRVTEMINVSVYLQSRMIADAVNNKGLKKIGLGHVLFRGSNAKSGLQTADIDTLILDEYDELVPANIPDAERRIAGSLRGRIRRIGNPSYPDFGIHKLYETSDQREWLVRCEHCRYIGKRPDGERLLVPRGYGWQALDFYENVDQDRRLVVCAGCEEPLDVAKGHWTKQQPTATVPGFHLSRLMVTTLAQADSYGNKPIDDVIAASKAKDDFAIQTFWNKDLGLPFEVASGRITLEQLQAARSIDIQCVQQPGYAGEKLVTMGVDVASVRALNVRISEYLGDKRNRKRALFIGTVEDEPGGPDAFTRLCQMMDLYSVDMAVVDHEPDGRLARAFAQTFLGRVYVCAYSMGIADAISINYEQKRVTVQRTLVMDATRKMMQELRNVLPQNIPEDYVPQMRAPVRKTRDNSMGEKVAFYESRSPDDFYHAETFDIIAREVYIAQQEIEDAQREVYQPLDSLMPFQRSSVSDLEDSDWRPGPREDDEYSPGWDDTEGPGW